MLTNKMKVYEEEIFFCPLCHEESPMEECMELNGEMVCMDCYDENTVRCSYCDEIICMDENVGDRDTPLCQRCFDYHYTRCESCDRVVSYDDVFYADDDPYHEDPYCENCYDRYAFQAINEYSYKPEPIFYGDGNLYLGVELEIDHGGKDSSNAKEILGTANQTAEHIYIKSDSSLDDGMEIVTHPCTLEYHSRKFSWKEIVKCALQLGYYSHQTTTCGLHIHVNRNAFSEDYEVQETCIGRILFFMEKHWEELLRFSRRTQKQLDQWANRYGLKGTPKETLHHAKTGGVGRYAALNLNNYSTIEFRLFRGTLKYNTLIAALQLVDTICKAAITLSDEEMSLLSWTNFVEQIEYPELITYLKERRLYINELVEISEEM